MERSYTVLFDTAARTTSRRRRGRSDFELPLEAASRIISEPPRPALHRERLTAPELEELVREPEFVAAAEIMRTRLLAPVNEPGRENERAKRPAGFANQSWGIAAVGADRSSFSGSGATVAVLDTGIDAEHPAFWGVDLVQKDFTGLGNGDHDGHGTHCAGTFFGRDVDGVRIGIARGVQTALIGRVLGPEGGDTNMLARAIHWAHEEGARVVAMPLGFDFPGTIKERIEQGWPDSLAVSIALESYRANVRLFESLLMMTRMQEPLTGGLLVVTAVGDDSQRSAKGDFVVSAGLPLAADATISVGALDPDPAGTGYRVSNFSNYGATISAPGRGIISAAAGGGLVAASGTGAACPHVAGVAALWWESLRQEDLPTNASAVRARLVASATGRGFAADVSDAERGAGRVCAPQESSAEPSSRYEWRHVRHAGMPSANSRFFDQRSRQSLGF